MRRAVLLGTLLALSAVSRAGLTIVFSPGQSIVLPASGKASMGVSGLLAATGKFTSISIVSASATGPGGTLSGATIDDLVLSKQVSGVYSGVLFHLPILSTLKPGVYRGNAQMKVRIGQTNSTSALAPFAFEVRAVPAPPVPEPATLGALGIGAAALLRRRRGEAGARAAV